MFSILRPFIFNLDPETAHDLAVQALKFNYLPSKIFKVENEEILNIEILGKKFPFLGVELALQRDSGIFIIALYGSFFNSTKASTFFEVSTTIL